MNIWIKRLLVLASVGGGFAGFALTSAQLFQSGQPVLVYALCIAVCLAYGIGIYGGIQLYEVEERGTTILSWYFLIQTVIFTSPVASFQFASGFMAYITLGTNGFLWGVYYGGRWQISLFQLSDPTLTLGVNFFAIWATVTLRRNLKKLGASQPTAPSEPPVVT